MMYEIGDYRIDENVAMGLIHNCTEELVRLGISVDTYLSHYEKLTISLQDGFDYEKFRKHFMCVENCINNTVIMYADYIFNRNAFLANAKIIKEQINRETLKEQNQQEVEQRAGFNTGDGLAQNIQANPVSDNKSRESATGLTFDTVPDQPQQQEQPTTQTDLNSIIYGTGNNQTHGNGEQKPKEKRPWCKYMLDRGSDAYLREKFKQLGRNDFDQVISIMRQLLSNRSAIKLIYNITRETNLLFGIRGVVDANNFSLWAYINEDKEIICCDFHNGTLNAYKQPSNQ